MRKALTLGAAVLCSGCSEQQLEPDVARVVTFSMVTSVEPGTEAEHCRFVQAPPEGILLNRDEVVFSQGSHHILLFDTAYEEIPTHTEAGEPIVYLDEEQGVFDCSDGVQFIFDTKGFLGGSQNVNGDSLVAFPPGVAKTIAPGRVFLLNAHYINTTPDVLTPSIDVKMHTIPKSEHEVEGGMLVFFDIFVQLLQQSAATATMRCNIGHDIQITNAQGHMHARGVGFEAHAIGPDGARRLIYEADGWENQTVAWFEDGMHLEAGSKIEHICHYQNDESRDIYMGAKTTDEMCMFIGSYYPADDFTSLCSGDEEDPVTTFFFGAEWPGQGEATCAESLQCFQDSADLEADPFEVVRALTPCVYDADPAVAPELSAAVGCSIGKFMQGENPLEGCSEQYVACLAK